MSVTFQKEIVLEPKSRAFHLITEEIKSHLPKLPKNGLLHLFIRHSSAGLCLNENYDIDVRRDLKVIFDELAPENHPKYRHTSEGLDDMPAHVKSVLCGSSVSIPIIDSELGLGTWQGIYLGEFRDHAGSRKIIITIMD